MNIVEQLAMVVITKGTTLGSSRQLITIILPHLAKRVGEGKVDKYFVIIVERIVEP